MVVGQGPDIGEHIVRILQRKRTDNKHVCLSVYLSIYRQTYFKELAHMITEANKPKIGRMGWWARDPEGSQRCS